MLRQIDSTSTGGTGTGNAGWMCATEWINVLDNWRRELCEEDDDDYWDTSYEIYFWTHEIEEGREQ